MIDLLDYTTSPLVLILKIIAPLIFLVVLGCYVFTRRYYSEKIRVFIDSLILFALFAFVAGWLRIYADGTEFGFTKEYSLRWFQSVGYIAASGAFMYAGYTLLHLFEEDKP
ncbi:hypothetical protein [Methanoregula sp.]|uniref:hypothetical protein n=1 Tax=Methanoregula sp. TaxID=2052170 RepID=UPI00236BB0A5|nr:hypothetical protein [Methanoregula sp.]MDD1687455.1 hypothetical protein [Methanoregula sp.]